MSKRCNLFHVEGGRVEAVRTDNSVIGSRNGAPGDRDGDTSVGKLETSSERVV